MVETSSKDRAGWLLWFGIVFTVFILFFALLPVGLSSQWGKERVLRLAAPHIPGEIQIDDWSLRWFGSQHLAGLAYTDRGAGLQASVPEITIARGLAAFLVDRGDLGTVTVTRPDIQIRLPGSVSQKDSAGVRLATDGSPTGKAEPSATVDEYLPAEDPLVFPPISGRLHIQKGLFSVFKPGEGAEVVAADIYLEANIASLADDITYSLSMVGPAGDGAITGGGRVILQGAETAVGSIRTAGNMQVTNWGFAHILELMAAIESTPTGSGYLQSTISFEGSLNEGIKLEGTIDLSDLELSGGPLGDDHPFIKKTSLEFTSTIGLDSLELSSLELTSPMAAGTLSASVAVQGPLEFGADFQVNLKEVASHFPHTLNLQDGLEITDGMLAIKGQLQSDQEINRFSGDALIEGMAGIRGGQEISQAKPFAVSLTGEQEGERLSLENITIQSSFLEGAGQGDQNDLQFSLEADLGAALAEISKFFALQEYAAEGQLNVTLEAQRKDEAALSLTAQLDADNVLVKHGKTVLIPEKPLNLTVAGDLLLSSDLAFKGIAQGNLEYEAWLGQGSLVVRDLLLSPDKGIQAIGELTGDNQLRLSDLGVMLTRLGAIPESLALSGNSHVMFEITGENESFLIDNVLVDSPKFSMQKDGVQLIPATKLMVKGSSQLALDNDGSLTTVNHPRFSYQSWIGDGTVQAVSVEVATLTAEELGYTGTTHLGRLAEILTALELLPSGTTFSGMDSSSLKMDYSPEKIDLAFLNSEIKDFVFTEKGKNYRDRKVVIETSGTVDMLQRSAFFSPLHIDSSNGTISLEQIAVGDWSNAANTLEFTGQSRFSLSTVLDAVRDWYSVPPDVSTAATIDVNWLGKRQRETDHNSYLISADLSDFSLTKQEQQVFNDEKVEVQIDASRNPTNGSIELNQINIASSLLDFNAAGFWNPNGEIGTEFGFNGNIGVDLARIAVLARNFTELDLEMVGKSDRPFELRGKIPHEQGQQWLRHTDFKGSFQADIFKVLGVELSALEIPIILADGIAQAEVQARANQGGLLMTPQLDMRGEPPVLTIPDNSQVLDKMQITREMANQLLARIHPLFMGASQMSGTVDLHLERFYWPLGRDSLNDLQFSGFMDLNEVQVESSMMLGALLRAVRVQETSLDLSGRQIRFEAKDGRIATNPLRTNLSDTELVISGSLGLDTTIDYLAQVEVTERLVGGDLYNYLEGTMINVPIGGTLSKPDISGQTVQRSVTDLINQAGRKKLQDAAGNLLQQLF